MLQGEKQSARQRRSKQTHYVRVDRSEVTFHTANFLFEDFVPESCLELALSQGCRRDVHSLLATTKQDLLWWFDVSSIQAHSRQRDLHMAGLARWLRC